MALIKVGNSLLTTGGSSLLEHTGIGEFLYLTYFRNFALTANDAIDIPEIGDTTNWIRSGDREATFNSDIPMVNYYGSASGHDIDVNYTNLPCVTAYDPRSNWDSDSYYSTDQFFDRANTPCFSVEVIMNHLSNTCYWEGMYLSGALEAYRNQWSGSRGIAIQHLSNLIDHVSSGFVTYSVGGYGVCISRQDSDRYKNGITHIAEVVDLDNNSIKGYIDGVLAFTGRPDRNTSGNIGFFVGYSRVQFTQFAIRYGDCSINGGDSYLVPTVPYRSF